MVGVEDVASERNGDVDVCRRVYSMLPDLVMFLYIVKRPLSARWTNRKKKEITGRCVVRRQDARYMYARNKNRHLTYAKRV